MSCSNQVQKYDKIVISYNMNYFNFSCGKVISIFFSPLIFLQDKNRFLGLVFECLATHRFTLEINFECGPIIERKKFQSTIVIVFQLLK